MTCLRGPKHDVSLVTVTHFRRVHRYDHASATEKWPAVGALFSLFHAAVGEGVTSVVILETIHGEVVGVEEEEEQNPKTTHQYGKTTRHS